MDVFALGSESYPTLDWMIKRGIELTRENYIALNYPDTEPESELELPPRFRNDAQ